MLKPLILCTALATTGLLAWTQLASQNSPAATSAPAKEMPAVGTPAPKSGSQGKADSKGMVEIEWLDLLPPEELKALEALAASPVDHSRMFDPVAEDQGSFNTVPQWNQRLVRIPGYIVPLDQTKEGKLNELFLVPFFGACIHAPPPPPNQIIYAKLKKPVEMTDLYSAYWLEGILRTERISTDMAGAAYSLEVKRIQPYE
jgi:uncharacterized protein